jgi:hypothetical protein
VEAEPVHDGVAEHVHGVSEERGGVREEAGDGLGQEHPGVDREHDLQHATLSRRDVGAHFAALVHGSV